jgi:hypothetical protein
MKYIFIILGLVLFLGCAPRVWTKPNTTSYDFESDKAACAAMAQAALANSDSITYAFNFGPIVMRCLEGKGWREVSEQ